MPNIFVYLLHVKYCAIILHVLSYFLLPAILWDGSHLQQGTQGLERSGSNIWGHQFQLIISRILWRQYSNPSLACPLPGSFCPSRMPIRDSSGFKNPQLRFLVNPRPIRSPLWPCHIHSSASLFHPWEGLLSSPSITFCAWRIKSSVCSYSLALCMITSPSISTLILSLWTHTGLLLTFPGPRLGGRNGGPVWLVCPFFVIPVHLVN